MSKSKKIVKNFSEFDNSDFADDYDLPVDRNDINDIVSIAEATTPDNDSPNSDIRELDEFLQMDGEETEELDELLEEAMQASFYLDSHQFPREDHPHLYRLLDRHGDEIYQSIIDDKKLQVLYHSDHSILAKHFEDILKQICHAPNETALRMHLAELGIHNIDTSTLTHIHAENNVRAGNGKAHPKAVTNIAKNYLHAVKEITVMLPASSKTKALYQRILGSKDSDANKMKEIITLAKTTYKEHTPLNGKQKHHGLFKSKKVYDEGSTAIHKAIAEINLSKPYDGNTGLAKAIELQKGKRQQRKRALDNTLAQIGLSGKKQR